MVESPLSECLCSTLLALKRFCNARVTSKYYYSTCSTHSDALYYRPSTLQQRRQASHFPSVVGTAWLPRLSPQVTVDCTPDGKGDCVVCLGSDGRADSGSCGDSGAVFVKPEERRMKFQEFADDLLAAKECCEGIRPEPQDMGMGVPYLSHQVRDVVHHTHGVLLSTSARFMSTGLLPFMCSHRWISCSRQG